MGPKLMDEDLRRFADWDMYVKMLASGIRFKGTPVATFKYMWHGDNIQLTRPVNETTADVTTEASDPSWKPGEIQ